MDMSNATAAGPSYGLFDVLFGSAPKEETGDGQEFGPMMDIIKALNKGKEELSQGGSRTDKGTVSEVGAGESRAMMASEKDAMAAELAQNRLESETRDRELRERMQALFGIGMVQGPAAMNQAPATPEMPEALPTLDAKEINRALKEKSLPGLSESEQKLLEAVNGKLAATNAEQALSAKEQASASALEKELAGKGINPRDIKSGEAQGTTPEKIVSTETYLKMHEAFGKNQAKDAGVTKRLVAVDDVPPQGVSGPESLVRNAVAESEGKGKNQDLLGNAHRQGLDKLDGDSGSKVKGPGSGAFAEMMQSLKGEGSLETKDVFLSGKPEQMRPVLMGEVQQGVNVQALKGGGEMRLVVHPPELGEVHLKVGTKEGKVEVSVTAENNKVADMIRGGSKELESSLQDKNLTLAKFEVTVSDQVTVASSDTKSSQNDQFSSQNQNGFLQGNGREGSSSARRESNQGREPNFGSFLDEPARSGPGTRVKNSARAPVLSSAGRLDVVA